MTWGIMPGYHFQVWKGSVFCMAWWKVLKNKISSSVQVRWVPPGSSCTATMLTCYPQARHGSSSRERWVCPRAYRSCSRTQGLRTPVCRCSWKRGVWWLRPQDPAVSAWRTTVIPNLLFCLHFQCSISLITAGPLPIMLWNASGATGKKKDQTVV